MKKQRIAIRPLPSPECVVSLAATVTALKLKYPGSELGMVGEENLREASLLLPDLDFFVSDMESSRADLVVDLVSAEVFEDSGENQSWKAYTHGTLKNSEGNPYHLVDLLRKVANVDTVDANFELGAPELSESLPSSLFESGFRMAICVGSLSQEEIEKILEGLAQLSHPPAIYLVGTIKDKKISGEASTKWDGKLNITDLCGHLSLPAQATVLRTCDINITGPGLSSLLSSGYGTFTICLDRNPAGGPLLYPYGHGHMILQKEEGESLESQIPSMLKDIIQYALSANSGNVPSVLQWQHFAEEKISTHLGKIRIQACQRMETKFENSENLIELNIKPLLFSGQMIGDIFQSFYRLIWEHSLNHREISTNDLDVLHQSSIPALSSLLKPMEQLYELGTFGRTYSSYVKDSLAKGDIAKAKSDSQKLQEVEELIQSLVESNPVFYPLFAFHRESQRLMIADTPITLSDEMTSLFSGLQERLILLLDLSKTLFHTVFQNELAQSAGQEEKADFHG